jgi:hypothetical protein
MKESKVTNYMIEQAIALSKIPCFAEVLKKTNLTDIECLACYYFYKRLEVDLTKLYPHYNLAWRAVTTDFETFRGFVSSRWSGKDYEKIAQREGWSFNN